MPQCFRRSFSPCFTLRHPIPSDPISSHPIPWHPSPLHESLRIQLLATRSSSNLAETAKLLLTVSVFLSFFSSIFPCMKWLTDKQWIHWILFKSLDVTCPELTVFSQPVLSQAQGWQPNTLMAPSPCKKRLRNLGEADLDSLLPEKKAFKSG